MRWSLSVLAALVLGTGSAWAEIAVVHPTTVEHSLSTERIRDMLLGRVTTWRDGSPVILVIVDNPADNAILLEIAGRDRDRLVRGWRRLVFAGNGAMPLLVDDSKRALETVAQHPGAIALMAKAPTDPRWLGIKVGEPMAALGVPAATAP